MILIVNHKANINYDEIIKYEKKLRKLDLIVLPTICYLPLFKKGKYILGSQDISAFKEKNRTGEINGEQLKHLNVKYSLVGHSDRIEYNYETKEILIKKLNRCFENNIIPLYCLGETSNENYKEEIINEIELYYENFKDNEVILIYEPRKNIGNSNADLSMIEEIISFIKKYIKDKYNKTPKLIYGGGVRFNNLSFIKKIKEIDGIIISSESMQIEKLIKLYKETRK